MEKRNIQIDLTIARQWYRQEGNLKELALQAFSEKELIPTLPATYKEYLKVAPPIGWHVEFSCTSPKQSKQYVTLGQLIRIRDYYNQDWRPDWTDANQQKYAIVTVKNELSKNSVWFANYIFAFKTRELRDEFFINFKTQLEFIKEFL